MSRLFDGGTVIGLSDAQLLDRFLAEGDAASFEVLVARHGPMVLSVCRGVLHDPDDVEDRREPERRQHLEQVAQAGIEVGESDIDRR